MAPNRADSTTIRTADVISAVGDVIDMYVEYLEQHGRDHEGARAGAIGEFMDWLATLCDLDVVLPTRPAPVTLAAPVWHDRLTTVDLTQRIAYDYHKEHWAARGMTRGVYERLEAAMPRFNDCDFEGCEDSRALIARVTAETAAIEDLRAACVAAVFQIRRGWVAPDDMTPSRAFGWNEACDAFRASGICSRLDEAVKRCKHLPGGNDAKGT